MGNRFTLFVWFFVIVLLFVVGCVAWVYYYNLSHVVSDNQPAMSMTTTSVQGSTEPSPKTAAAMLAIQKLTKGLPVGYLDAVPIPRVLQPASTTEFSTSSRIGLTFNVPKNITGFTLMKAATINTTTLAQWTSVSSTIKTDYDWESAVLNSAPGQVVSSTPGDQAAIISLLLDSKLLLLPPVPVYSFDAGVVKGFQHGDATTTRQIVINLFDQNNNMFDLVVSGTQDEIDYILASIKSE